MGNFTTALDPAKERHFVAFAAGSGITPILSILKTVLRSEPKSRFTLFYGNTDQDRIIFRKKLGRIEDTVHRSTRSTSHPVPGEG